MLKVIAFLFSFLVIIASCKKENPCVECTSIRTDTLGVQVQLGKEILCGYNDQQLEDYHKVKFAPYYTKKYSSYSIQTNCPDLE